jgi:hypothetical protein
MTYQKPTVETYGPAETLTQIFYEGSPPPMEAN